MPTDPSDSTTLHDSGEGPIDSARADAVHEAMLSQGSVVEMHRRIAMRLLREGSPVQAFQELVRASREVPMNPRLAGSLALLALHSKTFGPALTLLRQGLDETEDDERIAVMRQLARLARRSGDLERGREVLTQLLAERPNDRRARAILNALLEREERWEELDASLERETRFALKRGALVTASRLALRRARVWDTRHDDHARAALRYMQGAQYAEQAQDFERAFVIRLLWLRALHRADAPDRALADAAAVTLAAGERVNQRDRARALVDELGLARAPTPAAPMPAASPRRSSTQLELVAVAEAAERAGHRSEAAAVLAVAVREGPDPRAARKLEALHIQRGAWRELAALYKDLVSRSTEAAERAGWAEKLAELLESELDDARGAAAAWAVVVAATGDARAVSEQVRLLALSNDGVGIRAALDAGVQQAHSPAEKASALVLRAEEALSRREVAQARADFQQALEAVPEHPQAAAGLAELAAMQGQPALIRAFEAALSRLPRHVRGRGDLYRRLARLAETPLRDSRLALSAWAEVLVELPGDAEATARSIALTRAVDDEAALERQLRAAIATEPRGPKARELRLDLVALLDRLGRADDALTALKEAVKAEPGHREAWLSYADRLAALGGRDAEVAWSLEHAATATEDPTARAELWRRLGRFARERLGDEEKALGWERRADRIEKDLEVPEETTSVLAPRPGRKESREPVLPGGPLVIPPRRTARPKPRPPDQAFEELAATLDSRSEPPSRPPPRAPERVVLPAVDVSARAPERAAPPAEIPPPIITPVEERLEDAPLIVDRPKPEVVERGGTQEIPVQADLGDPLASLPPSFGPLPSRTLGAERVTLFERVRNNPLEPDGYRMLAEHFDTANDAARSSLMLELARALEGDPFAAPRTPRLILSVSDRAGLRHPSLRGEEGELLSLTGLALCSLYPARGRDAGTNEEFHLESGRGAKSCADALLAAVRILGLRAPDVYVSEDSGPPFFLVFAGIPKLLVGRLAVRRELSGAELRFFAGRALFTQQPELMALRNLRREQLLRGLNLIAQVARGRAEGAEARIVRDAIPQKAWERVRQLSRTALPTLDVAKLAEGARNAVNRAGLIVCGGVAPAIAALKAKKALPSETIELVRFAASERYLQLRGRVLGRR